MTETPLAWIPIAVFGAIVVATVCSLFVGPRRTRRPSDAPVRKEAGHGDGPGA